MKRKSLFLLIMTSLFLAGLLNSCYYDQFAEEEEIIIIDPETPLSFSDDIMPIFNAGCNTTGCHDPGGFAPDLSTSNAYDALISGGYIDTDDPEKSELYQWMAGNRGTDMPLEGPNAEWNAIVLEWINQGAKDN